MRIILFILSAIAFFLGCATLTAAESALHEIEGMILFVVWAILLCGAGIVEAINRHRGFQEEAVELLRRIAGPDPATATTATPPAKQALCDACEQRHPLDQLHRIASGQLLCPACRSSLSPATPASGRTP